MSLSTEQFVKRAIDSGLEGDGLREATASYIKSNSNFKTKKQSFADKPFEEQIQDIGSLTKEQRSNLTPKQQFVSASYRNVGKEKPFWQKAIEGTAGAVGFGAQMASEGIGKVIGGKAGSAVGAGSSAMAQSLIRENWQNLMGRQDETMMGSAGQPFKDAGIASATDLAFNFMFDDILPAGKTKVSNFFRKLTGKTKKGTYSLAGEIVANSPSRAYETLSNTGAGGTDPAKFFLDEGMGNVKWWQRVPNQYGTGGEPLGTLINKKKIGTLSKELEPILKEAGDNGVKLTYIDAEKLFESQRGNLMASFSKDGVGESALRQVAEDGSDLLDDVLLRIKKGGATPADVKKMATALNSGAYTVAKKGKIGKSPTAQRKVATMLTSWLKSNVDGTSEILMRQTRLYRLNAMIKSIATKAQREFGKDFAGNLSRDQIKRLSQTAGGSLLSVGGAAAGNPAIALGGAGIAATQAPYLSRELAGGAPGALFKQLQSSVNPIKESVKEGTGELIKTAGKTSLIQNLTGKF